MILHSFKDISFLEQGTSSRKQGTSNLRPGPRVSPCPHSFSKARSVGKMKGSLLKSNNHPRDFVFFQISLRYQCILSEFSLMSRRYSCILSAFSQISLRYQCILSAFTCAREMAASLPQVCSVREQRALISNSFASPSGFPSIRCLPGMRLNMFWAEDCTVEFRDLVAMLGHS